MSRTIRKRPQNLYVNLDVSRDGIRDDVHHFKPDGMGICGYLGENIRSSEAKRSFKRQRSRRIRRALKKIGD